MPLTHTRKAQLGLNLVELMIGLVVGLVVLAAISTVYLNTARGSRDTLNANRLNQDLRAVMDIMVADIRRAGYWGTAAPSQTNCFTLRTPRAANPANCANPPVDKATDIYIPSSDCILYSYDATYTAGNAAGTPDPGVDFFGFRLNGGAVQSVTPGTGMNNTHVACNSLAWSSLTDPEAIVIDNLTFSTASPGGTEPGSQCVNTTTGVAWSLASTTEPACSDTSADPLYDKTLHNLVETRQITISITAHHKSDTPLSRTLTESVLVRNNRIITP